MACLRLREGIGRCDSSFAILANDPFGDFFDLRDGILWSFGTRRYLIYILKEGC